MTQQLFMMVGYPGSGKSHFARQLADRLQAVRLNGDGARHMMFDYEDQRRDPENNRIIFGALDYASQQVLHAGYSVVYDASHNRRADRAHRRALGEKYGLIAIVVWIQVPIEVAKHRYETRERTPDQPVLRPGRFEELAKTLDSQKPDVDEARIIIDGTASFEEQFTSFEQQLKRMTEE